MFRDDHLEYKNGTLQVKMSEIPTGGYTVNKNTQKPKRTTKFDFSGTNYETCTLGHIACLEAILDDDPELIDDICKQARELASVGVRKLCDDRDSNKYATLQTNPEFLARALLFKKGKKKYRTNEASGNEGNNLIKIITVIKIFTA